VNRLNRLDDVLAAQNPSRTDLERSQAPAPPRPGDTPARRGAGTHPRPTRPPRDLVDARRRGRLGDPTVGRPALGLDLGMLATRPRLHAPEGRTPRLGTRPCRCPTLAGARISASSRAGSCGGSRDLLPGRVGPP
jgi:hypothetical protein